MLPAYSYGPLQLHFFHKTLMSALLHKKWRQSGGQSSTSQAWGSRAMSTWGSNLWTWPFWATRCKDAVMNISKCPVSRGIMCQLWRSHLSMLTWLCDHVFSCFHALRNFFNGYPMSFHPLQYTGDVTTFCSGGSNTVLECHTLSTTMLPQPQIHDSSSTSTCPSLAVTMVNMIQKSHACPFAMAQYAYGHH
jgi:hypothetical protein